MANYKVGKVLKLFKPFFNELMLFFALANRELHLKETFQAFLWKWWDQITEMIDENGLV
jgi:hypothetical protein